MTETSGTSPTGGREYSSARSIVIFGNYGNGNLGDEATLQAMLGLLRRRIPGVGIVAFATNPAEATSRHGIRAEPATRLAARATPIVAGSSPPAGPRQRVKAALGRVPLVLGVVRGGVRLLETLGRVVRDPFLELRQFRTLRRADCLVVGGGGQLSEPVDVFASLPMRVLKLTLLAKLAGRPVLILNVGVIPLRRRSTRLVVRSVLRLADYCSVRDEPSRSIVERLGVPTPDVHPDLAYVLQRPDDAERQRTRTVAINVFPHFDGRYLPAAGGRYQAYLDTLSVLTLGVLGQGWSVMLVQTHLRADPPVLADFRARLAATPGWEALEPRLLERQISSVDDLVDALGSSDLVIATRYHAAVLAFALGRPVLALAAHTKLVAEMTEMGQDRFLFAADDADPTALLNAFERLEAERDAIAPELAARTEAKRTQLVQEFDHLFGPTRA